MKSKANGAVTKRAKETPRGPEKVLTISASDPTPASAHAWRGFNPGLWQRDINLRWFIQQNYTPYEGDEAFLAPATPRTQRIWRKLQDLFVEERKKGVLDIS